MSGLRDAIRTSDALLRRMTLGVEEPIHTTRAVTRIDGEVRDGGPVADIAALRRRVSDAVATARPASITSRDLRETCKTLFHKPLPPAEDADLCSALLMEVSRRRRSSHIHALLDAYLSAFDADEESTIRLARWLVGEAPGWPWRGHDPWRTRLQEVPLLEPDAGPSAVARSVLGSPLPAHRVLSALGLDTDGRRKGGMGLAAFLRACDIVEGAGSDDAVVLQGRLVEWAWPAGRGKDLDFRSVWPELAAALFMPWRAGAPPTEHQRRISSLAIDYAGDPRPLPKLWRDVVERRPQAVAVLKQWLVRASVLQFFEVVDSVAMERMWRYRRAFWRSYVEAELVDDAWLVFGSAGAAEATYAAERSGEAALKQFGRLESGGGRAPNHACLLMRIGDLTIAEWSHNGRCYMWRRSDANQPKLGQRRYHPDELAHPNHQVQTGRLIGIAHHNPEGYGWQKKVANEIQDQTGVRTNHWDWAP